MQGSAVVDDLANFAVELTVPLGTRHAMTVRTVVASVAADIGLNVDEIDDLRLAVSEVFTILVEAARDADRRSTSEARCEVRLEVADGDSEVSMAVTLSSTATLSTDMPSAGTIELDALARSILESVVDGYDLVVGGIVIRKRCARPDDASAFDRSI